MSYELEQEYLKAAQEGDDDAYEKLQLLLDPQIRRFVFRLINNADEAEDIAQDVFIAFYRNFRNIDPPANLRPYIFRIARNRCYDILRRNGRRECISLDDDPVQARISFIEAHAQPQPDDVVHWLLLHLEVRAAMEKLPESQREALILYAEEGLTYGAIAEIMEVSPGTIKSRIYYAKRNLRGHLRPEILAALDDELYGNASGFIS